MTSLIHSEWIASGSLPLATVLASAGSPLIASVTLKSPSIYVPGVVIKLDVSVDINVDRLTPYFELPEESILFYLPH